MTYENISERPSSSADDFGTTPSTYVHSEVNETKQLHACDGNESQTVLPSPFFPPSLSRQELSTELPSALCTAPQVPLERAYPQIDTQDLGTPDAWIPRDPRLVRLTGKHPLNCEPKLSDLFASGFLTPSHLFFVRSHGAVPRVSIRTAEDWKIEIHGLCSNPVTFSILELCNKFDVVTIPVTLVCAGNRRKEQNVVRKSLGFSWGGAGVSTALFTGVYLADVLDYVCPSRHAKHVIFESCDQLPDGPYGTSQRIGRARDRQGKMMLSWAMNGLPLEPDHGFPLRLVVPGHIGGRSVKWLTRIELSATESQHHLHFHDNKVLPMALGPDRARVEKEWWYDPRYIINDLNVNSVIAVPNHNEILDTEDKDPRELYVMRGYAYAGGGRRVTRVEISLDDGKTWNLASVVYPEDRFRTIVYSDTIYGRVDLTDSESCFCWCFWSYEISLAELNDCDVISVRCMDESLALQPRDMYWSATGMMNNWWFRVCVHKLGSGRLQFEHPTMPGTQPGGWMQRIKEEGQDPLTPNFSKHTSPSDLSAAITRSSTPPVLMTNPAVKRMITLEELQAHNTKERPWFVVDGEVYDGTDFLAQHPGGVHSITLVAGEDATEDFIAIHSSDAKKQLANFHIGKLIGGALGSSPPHEDDTTTSHFLNKKWKEVVLTNIETRSRDVKLFRFALDRPDREFGLPIGQHVYVRLRRKVSRKEDGKLMYGELVQRAYTPLSRLCDRGFVDLLIKIYYPNAQFSQGGRMTLGLSELSVGDVVELKGPIGHFIWKSQGTVLLDGTERRVREFGMVCAGSGITPVLQVVRGIFGDLADVATKVSILYVNRLVGDILCREELDSLAAQNLMRFQIHYSLTGNPIPSDWPYSTGRINEEMLKIHLPEAGEDKIVCICGPPLMEQKIKDFLTGLGWDPAAQIVIF